MPRCSRPTAFIALHHDSFTDQPDRCSLYRRRSCYERRRFTCCRQLFAVTTIANTLLACAHQIHTCRGGNLADTGRPCLCRTHQIHTCREGNFAGTGRSLQPTLHALQRLQDLNLKHPNLCTLKSQSYDAFKYHQVEHTIQYKLEERRFLVQSMSSNPRSSDSAAKHTCHCRKSRAR